METFHIIVLAIAAGALILILTSVGTMMSKSNRNVRWPPTSAICPDGWEPDTTTPGKCYTPAKPTNYGKVVMAELGTTNTTNGYALETTKSTWESGDAWHFAGTASNMSADRKTIYPDSKSDFKYFRAGDLIKLVGNFNELKSIEGVVSSITAEDKTAKPPVRLSLTLTTALPVDPRSQIKYYGKRMSIDFTKPVYTNICDKRKWARANKVRWDGVSNYNKCKSRDLTA